MRGAPGDAHRAEELARLLEGERPGPGHAVDAQARDLARLAARIEATAVVMAPRPEFRAALRDQLLAERIPVPLQRAQSLRRGDDVPPPPGAVTTPDLADAARRWRRVAAGVAASITIGSTGTAFASMDALPGDLLYGVKRAIENVQLELLRSDEARGERRLEHAAERIEELEALLADGDASPELLRSTLEDLDAATREAAELLLKVYDETGDAELLRTLGSALAEQSDRLEALVDVLPAEVVPPAERQLSATADGLEEVRRRADACGPACDDVRGEAMPLDPAAQPGGIAGPPVNLPQALTSPGRGPDDDGGSSPAGQPSGNGGSAAPGPVRDPVRDTVRAVLEPVVAPKPPAAPESTRPVAASQPQVPPVDLPAVALPQLPPVDLPPVALPQLPPVDLPPVALPQLPPVDLPPVELPDLPPVKVPDVPRVEVPDVPPVKVPDVPRVEVPDLPPVKVPELPPVELPDLPPVELPDLPPVKVPDLPPVKVPDLPPVEVPDLPPVELPDVPPVEVPDLPPVEVPDLPPVELPDIPPVEVPDLPPVELPDIPPVEVPDVPPVEVPDLPPVEVPDLPPVDLPDVPPVGLPGIPPDGQP
jgi:hypothetical protein